MRTKMNNQTDILMRPAFISYLIGKSYPNKIGHTTLMKLIFLLQKLKNVPLGYVFRLYTYGPYDSDVLEDLKYAEALNAVKSKIELYQKGYSYSLTPGENHSDIETKFKEELDRFDEDINWVINEFGKHSAAELELISTLIYSDRNNSKDNNDTSLEEIVHKVHRIKSHFNIDTITKEAESLKEKGYLLAK